MLCVICGNTGIARRLGLTGGLLPIPTLSLESLLASGRLQVCKYKRPKLSPLSSPKSTAPMLNQSKGSSREQLHLLAGPSPPSVMYVGVNDEDLGSGRLPSRTSNKSLYAAGALVGLCAVTTSERVAFKMLIDRVVPFRFLVLVLVVLFEALALMAVVSAKGWAGTAAPSPTGFPRRKLLIMAALDLTKDLMMVLTGAFVPPTLTVMLLQCQIPISMGLAHLQTGTSRGYRTMHYAGAGAISLAIALAFVPVMVHWVNGGENTG